MNEGIRKPIGMGKLDCQPNIEGVLADIAALYDKNGLTQSEIAGRIGVSRPAIVNYIKQAREQGIDDTLAELL